MPSLVVLLEYRVFIFRVKTHSLTFIRRTRMVLLKKLLLELLGGVAFGEPLL
jgi:hypothetical protein